MGSALSPTRQPALFFSPGIVTGLLCPIPPCGLVQASGAGSWELSGRDGRGGVLLTFDFLRPRWVSSYNFLTWHPSLGRDPLFL